MTTHGLTFPWQRHGCRSNKMKRSIIFRCTQTLQTHPIMDRVQSSITYSTSQGVSWPTPTLPTSTDRKLTLQWHKDCKHRLNPLWVGIWLRWTVLFLIKLWGLWRLSPVQRIRSAILSKTLLTKSFTKYFAYLTSSVCVGLSKEVSHFFSVHLYRVLREVNSFHRCLSLNKRTPLRTAQCHILHLDKMAANWDVLNGSRLMHLTGGEVRSIITHYDFEDVISSEYGSLQWWLIVRLWSSVW